MSRLFIEWPISLLVMPLMGYLSSSLVATKRVGLGLIYIIGVGSIVNSFFPKLIKSLDMFYLLITIHLSAVIFFNNKKLTFYQEYGS